MHLDNADEVADHCLVFSLSDSRDTDFQEKCNDKHDAVCEQCLALEDILKVVEGCFKATEFPSVDESDDVHYTTVRSAVLAINSWKCHILRSSKQDQLQDDVLKLLDEMTVFIVNDWAMKFLPIPARLAWKGWHFVAYICCIQT